jgi:hypothetical protein
MNLEKSAYLNANNEDIDLTAGIIYRLAIVLLNERGDFILSYIFAIPTTDLPST